MCTQVVKDMYEYYAEAEVRRAAHSNWDFSDGVHLPLCVFSRGGGDGAQERGTELYSEDDGKTGEAKPRREELSPRACAIQHVTIPRAPENNLWSLRSSRRPRRPGACVILFHWLTSGYTRTGGRYSGTL